MKGLENIEKTCDLLLKFVQGNDVTLNDLNITTMYLVIRHLRSQGINKKNCKSYYDYSVNHCWEILKKIEEEGA